ncbi:MAG TPA: hypothetical protein VI733_00480 [Candidatus Limnocylindria bacterium]|nr:hypothetical protein [Candidatus Limnocylindria bacterium]
MSHWIWLIGAVASGWAAYLVGLPAWRDARARTALDTNAERYLAWRGRGGERPRPTGYTPRERQRLIAAAVLALVAAFCLVGFFTYA